MQIESFTRSAIGEVALDPYAGYNAAVREALPHACITIDSKLQRLLSDDVQNIRPIPLFVETCWW